MGIIGDELERRKSMSAHDKNYIRYYMLTLLPEDYLSGMAETSIFGPKKTGFPKVSKYYRDAYPYRKARPTVEAVLQVVKTQ